MFQRNEYPRPQFRRDSWTKLNGTWQFSFDDNNVGLKEKWYLANKTLNSQIVVPFSYQYKASGIGDESVHEVIWYKRKFEVEPENAKKRALLCFNGVFYRADVFVNGSLVCSHEGGYAPFKADITDYIKKGENDITVRCYAPLAPTYPRGKQSWQGHRFGCWYICNSGIWQSVWIEYFLDDCIDDYSLITNPDNYSFGGEVKTLKGIADSFVIDVYFNNKKIKSQKVALDCNRANYTVQFTDVDFVDESYLWTPENPKLFYADFTLYSKNKVVDICHTRFGMKKIHIDETGSICLNNKKLYQSLILDQGYFNDCGTTPPSAEILKKDIELSKQMGFNGARKHQKFEDPYFYYYADELGFLTWCEMPSAYNYNDDEVYMQTKEWQEIVKVARNFTSVICYVPLNESWGVKKIISDATQQNYARTMYYLTKTLDSSRLISTNDGWENVNETDITSIHDYCYDGKKFSQYTKENYNGLYPQTRKLIAHNNTYNGQPVLFTEFGGIAMSADAQGDAWGYNSSANNAEEFYTRYKNLMQAVHNVADFQGFCYTQLTDVQQEVNGLLDKDHNPKFDIALINEYTVKKD